MLARKQESQTKENQIQNSEGGTVVKELFVEVEVFWQKDVAYVWSPHREVLELHGRSPLDNHRHRLQVRVHRRVATWSIMNTRLVVNAVRVERETVVPGGDSMYLSLSPGRLFRFSSRSGRARC